MTIKPSTALAWHRKLAARKWTFRQKPKGRPATENEVCQLVIEMKTNNLRWAARRIVGELHNLGKVMSKFTVLNILKESGFPGRIRRCDGIYGEWLGTFLKDCYEIALYRTSPGMPNCNAFIERWNRPHQTLEQDYPCKKHGKIDFDRSKIRRERLVDGLIVDYGIAA